MNRYFIQRDISSNNPAPTPPRPAPQPHPQKQPANPPENKDVNGPRNSQSSPSAAQSTTVRGARYPADNRRPGTAGDETASQGSLPVLGGALAEAARLKSLENRANKAALNAILIPQDQMHNCCSTPLSVETSSQKYTGGCHKKGGVILFMGVCSDIVVNDVRCIKTLINK